MGFMKFASTQVLSVERETAMSRTASAAGLQTRPDFEVIQTEAGVKQAHRAHFDYERRPGYIYVRSRAISSRTNDNYDEFPAEEIKTAYRTFVGKPVFVNHHNDDHRRARGVIIDAALHEDTNPNGTPDTWVEVLMEVDAKRFPRLAAEVLKGNIARTSMGTNVEYSVCTACGNKAYSPVEYCQHIPRMKGMKIRRTTGSGGQEEVLIAERCYGLGFFENSLLVEDPADPTAFVLGVEGDGIQTAATRFGDAVFNGGEHLLDRADRAMDKADDWADRALGPTMDKIYDHLPSTKRRREEEKERTNHFFDMLQRDLKEQMDEDDEEFGLSHHAVQAAFDGVTVSEEDITTWRPDPADVVASNMREAMKAQGGFWRDRADEFSETYRGRPTKVTQEKERQEQRDQINAYFDTMKRLVEEGDEDYARATRTAATNKATCDECQTPYDYSRIYGTATFHIPSSGSRGSKYTPARDETVEGVTDDDVLWHFECPVCGYDNSQYTDAETAKALGHFHVDKHKHYCRYPVYGPRSIAPCGKELRSGGICPDHGPVKQDLQMAAGVGGVSYEPHKVLAEQIQEGDRLDRSGKTRISKIHDRNGVRHVQTQTIGTRSPSVARWPHGTEVTVYRPVAKQAKSYAPVSSGHVFKGGERVFVQPAYEGVGGAKPARVTRGYNGKSFHIRTEHAGAEHEISDDDLKSGNWIVRHASKTADLEPATDATAICDGCGKRHDAEYHHEGQWGEGHIYAVTCPEDGLTSWHTEEGIDRGTRKKSPPYLDLTREALGEVKAPAQVDTMRAERCPVCQDDEAYDGDRCGICGYVAPPEMFQDPNLDKAKEVDLRQDQMEQVDGDGNMAVDTADLDGQTGVLTCDACGEEFGPDAEAESAPDDGPAPVDPADQAAQADPDAAGAPQNADGTPAPDDLSDLADKTDAELGLEDGLDAQEDPAEAVSPVEQDPADDQSGVAPPADDGLTDSAGKGDVCPICGQGTIVSVQPGSTDPAATPKEKSRDMPDEKKTQPTNPAKAQRNRIVQALLGQQQIIQAQAGQIASLREAVLEIGTAAGLGNHPRFAALRVQADDTNQTPETAPATTSQEARQPDATDDPNNVGASPEGANVNVTPQAVTDVASTDKVEPGQPPLSNLVDVTAPPPAGAAAAPAAGPGDKVINPVTVGTPSQTTMDPAGSTGWKSSSKQEEDPMERHTASLRLARLRIAAGLARGEDLAVGEEISKNADLSLDTIKALSTELAQTLSARSEQAPTRQQAQRLVPRAAGGGRAPSLAATPEEGLDVTSSNGEGLDEWAFGMDGLSGE